MIFEKEFFLRHSDDQREEESRACFLDWILRCAQNDVLGLALQELEDAVLVFLDFVEGSVSVALENLVLARNIRGL